MLIFLAGKTEFRVSEEFWKFAGPVLIFGVEVDRSAACYGLMSLSSFEFG